MYIIQECVSQVCVCVSVYLWVEQVCVYDGSLEVKQVGVVFVCVCTSGLSRCVCPIVLLMSYRSV